MNLSNYQTKPVVRVDDFQSKIPTVFLVGGRLEHLILQVFHVVNHPTDCMMWERIYNRSMEIILKGQTNHIAMVITTTLEEQHALEWVHHRGYYDWEKRLMDDTHRQRERAQMGTCDFNSDLHHPDVDCENFKYFNDPSS